MANCILACFVFTADLLRIELKTMRLRQHLTELISTVHCTMKAVSILPIISNKLHGSFQETSWKLSANYSKNDKPVE